MTAAATAQLSCTARYSCGPARLTLFCDDRSLCKALNDLLTQYDALWPGGAADFSVTIEPGAHSPSTPEPSGAYLRSYRLRVDRRDAHLVSLSNVGVWMEFDERAKKALIRVPHNFDWQTVVEEVEQQLVLLLARAWSNQGWTPLHAGSLIPPEQNGCLLICAHSGVGKTTFVTSLLRRGWHTLGDDKALLQNQGGEIVARSLSRRLHLHPSLANWFPELGVIEDFPCYSRWTEKRNVGIEALWPGQLLDVATPTTLIQLERAASGQTLEVRPLDTAESLNALLRQIAIPSDSAHARPLIACAAQLAQQVRGVSVVVGENAFADSEACGRIEKSLLDLLP